ncbi:MAG: LamG domain-containing protein, partial [Deltaproteobacteria bacterium]|nr:LamG domain-containing protein [Deltaproteobacteria bacterium]
NNVRGAGQIGHGQIFDDIADYIEVDGAAEDADATQGTISAWVELNATGSQSTLFSVFADANNEINLKWTDSSDELRARYTASGVQTNVLLNDAAVFADGDGEKHLVTMTWDAGAGVDGELKLFVDGSQVGGTGTVFGTWTGDISTAVASIGANGFTRGNEFDGMIDEVRISDTARSADWIKASWLSQNGSFAFTVFGPEEA